MKLEQSNEEPLTQRLDAGLKGLDDLLGQNLSELQVLREIKTEALAREEQRLAQKLGDDHPRVQSLALQREHNLKMAGDLSALADAAQISVPALTENSWMVHGRVMNKDRRGMAGLTVGLFDGKWRWVESLGYACTNERGYFSIIYSATKAEAQEILKDKKLCLGVSDKNQKILYRDHQPLQGLMGSMEYREIYLADFDVCIPPTSGPADKVVSEDTWVVQGRVLDRKGSGQAGLTVRLYDKDLKFTDLLGTITTDADGHFQLSYRTKDFRHMIEAKPDLYLEVKDEQGRLLYSSKKAIRYNAGRVEIFNVTLTGKAR